MAQTILVKFNDEVSEFGLTRVQRDKIYGKRVRMIVDEEGNACKTAALTRDGAALLPTGSMAMVYLNDDFELCSRAELTPVDENGVPREAVPSTLGVEQKLIGPINPKRVLDHIAKSVYELDPITLDETLRTNLEAGEIFETTFNYRKGFDSAPAFLVKNDEGFFAIVGEETHFDFLHPDQVEGIEEDGEDPFDDDDLDFSMF